MAHDRASNTSRPGDTGWGTELRATFRLAWPLALANLLQMLVHAVDVVFVARLGERELAASALAIALFGLLMWALSGLTGIVSALIAEEYALRYPTARGGGGEAASLRAQAMKLLDDGGVDPDWPTITQFLTQSYRALGAALKAPAAGR